jgi:hypothetical protein
MVSRPSITSWSRLEPRPRADSTTQALNAEVRDAAWMLTRQWQFGEFDAEDAGSIAYAELTTSVSALTSWRPAKPPGSPTRPLEGNRPLEALIQAEPFTSDLATRVELGTTFAALLAHEIAPDPVPSELLKQFRTSFPIQQAPDVRVTAKLFELDWDFQQHPLSGDQPLPASLRAALDDHQIALGGHTRLLIAEAGSRWLILDSLDQPAYLAVDVSQGRLGIHQAVIVDRAAARFRQLCAGRAIDGVALYQAATASSPPSSLNQLAPAGSAARRAVDALTAWAHELLGELGTSDPPAWRPDRLEYDVELLTADNRVLAAQPSQDGGLDWHAFDLHSTPATEPGPDQASTSAVIQVLPDHVRFRGMPSPRWWEFQDRRAYLGSLQPDQRGLAHLIVQDFVLIYGNDWFLIPFSQPLGSLCTIDALVVHDVFGGTTTIPRADTIPTGNPAEPWTMFSTTRRGATPADDTVAPFLLLPAAAATTAQTSAAIEEVRFLRDELANLVWAVEHTTENGIGEPWPGHERDLAVRAATHPTSTPSADGALAPLTYQLQTSVPEHWLPMLPVSIDPQHGQIALVRGAMLGQEGDLIQPAGRLLQPTTPIPEEEVPRAGLQVQRITSRARWTDGSTHLWLRRQKRPAAQAASSGLRFDQAVSQPSGSTNPP